jgi:hypothetical protein
MNTSSVPGTKAAAVLIAPSINNNGVVPVFEELVIN